MLLIGSNPTLNLAIGFCDLIVIALTLVKTSSRDLTWSKTIRTT